MQAETKNNIKRIVDVGMTVLLLCLMSYQVTGEALHEWIGMGMTASFKWKDRTRICLVCCFAVVAGAGLYLFLKTVVDRFCAYNSSLNSRRLKSALLTVAWNADDWTFEALVYHYKTLVRYINFEDKGMVLGYGCGSPSVTGRSRYPQEAYQLGGGFCHVK